MNKTRVLLKKIVPELIELLEKRYNILRSLFYMQPVGRRTLANHLNTGERNVRKEVAFLKEQGLIETTPMGMSITPAGANLLENLKDFMHSIKGLSEFEEILSEALELKRIIIVPGDCDSNHLVLKEMGRVAANYLKTIIKKDSIIAVTGGTTVAEVANSFTPMHPKNKIMVVPARGGMGESVEIQASTIAAVLAKRIGGTYRLLHVPDNLAQHTLETVMNEPSIKEVINNIKKTNILVYGIGRADEMARRRRLDQEQMKLLDERGAVAEAFGYYFAAGGEVVYTTVSVGLRFEDLGNIQNIIGVAGGRQKARAIMAVAKHTKNSVLITDEGAAAEMIGLINA